MWTSLSHTGKYSVANSVNATVRWLLLWAKKISTVIRAGRYLFNLHSPLKAALFLEFAYIWINKSYSVELPNFGMKRFPEYFIWNERLTYFYYESTSSSHAPVRFQKGSTFAFVFCPRHRKFHFTWKLNFSRGGKARPIRRETHERYIAIWNSHSSSRLDSLWILGCPSYGTLRRILATIILRNNSNVQVLEKNFLESTR